MQPVPGKVPEPGTVGERVPLREPQREPLDLTARATRLAELRGAPAAWDSAWAIPLGLIVGFAAMLTGSFVSAIVESFMSPGEVRTIAGILTGVVCGLGFHFHAEGENRRRSAMIQQAYDELRVDQKKL